MTGLRALKTLMILGSSVLGLAACGEPEPVRVGFIAGLSGAGADTGFAARNALLMAVDDVNANGGIDGHPVELVIRDDQKDGDIGRSHVDEFSSLNVAAIIGPIISSVGNAMLPAINEHQIVTISPTVSAFELSGKDDHLFRINSTTRDNAQSYALHQSRLGRKTIAIALDQANATFTNSWADEFTRAFTGYGGVVVGSVPFNNTAQIGFSLPAEQLLALQSDAILLVANSFDSAQLALQIRKRGATHPIIAAEWAASEQLIAMGGAAVEGMELLQSYDRNDQSAQFRSFAQAYETRFKARPGYTSVATHDAATMLFSGLKQQAQTGMPLRLALLQLRDIQGLQQPLNFDQYGDSQRKTYHVVIRDGQFVAP
ncbi:ABC transporter substrate-binding protein [Thalassospira mesophila]|uniref:Leucine-binding protein domain-containing protein n=1 Tax=Thalassospira mesophila TaxID=1293891 RepID=A0A1Y2KXY2_9PROT|nr:ABC transporter substrate-binding protein [Thalassospira mesophila]OSQ35768.1 hypothetical protein TMES_20365 [Thalassospira mesophila]